MFLRPRSWLPRRIIDIYDTHRFEAATAWGLLWQRPYCKIGPDYLQVGSGDKHIEGFLNTEHFVSKAAEFHVDIRYPLPFEADRWRGIFAHHIVEHVWYEQAVQFFGECHRVLRCDGTLRVIVPDGEKFLRTYTMPTETRVAQFRAMLPESHLEGVRPPTAMGFVSYAVYSGPLNAHRSAWDYETMSLALEKGGFAHVRRVECGQSRDPKLCNLDTPHWAAQSLYVEAVKQSSD